MKSKFMFFCMLMSSLYANDKDVQNSDHLSTQTEEVDKKQQGVFTRIDKFITRVGGNAINSVRDTMRKTDEKISPPNNPFTVHEQERRLRNLGRRLRGETTFLEKPEHEATKPTAESAATDIPAPAHTPATSKSTLTSIQPIIKSQPHLKRSSTM